MPPMPVTALYAGALTLWILYLAWRVGAARQRQGVLLGDGGDPEVLREMRAHGNAIETIPLTLLLMALSEGLGAPPEALHLTGLGLAAGRVAHGLYFFGGAVALRLRALGMGLTMIVQAALALGLVVHAATEVF